MQEWIINQPHAKHCPSPDCNWVFTNEDDMTQNIECPNCHQRYCSNCLRNHRARVTCDQARILAEATEHTRDPETAQWLAANSKNCPSCKTPIQKKGGCNHMTCRMCRHEFCWICLGARTDLDSNNHRTCDSRNRQYWH